MPAAYRCIPIENLVSSTIDGLFTNHCSELILRGIVRSLACSMSYQYTVSVKGRGEIHGLRNPGGSVQRLFAQVT